MDAFPMYMNPIHPTSIPDPSVSFLFFLREREWEGEEERKGGGGVFFFLNHYPGNLIHTAHNGRERERLDGGVEEIMKFVHIQASWKPPPPSSLLTHIHTLARLPPPPFFSLQTDQPQLFPPPPKEEKRAQDSLLERVSAQKTICFQFVSVWRESGGNKWFQFPGSGDPWQHRNVNKERPSGQSECHGRSLWDSPS